MATPRPIPEPRREPQPIEPMDLAHDQAIDMEMAQQTQAVRVLASDLAQLLATRARYMDEDHEQALQVNAGIDRERLEPEEVDRERRAERRDSRQFENSRRT